MISDGQRYKYVPTEVIVCGLPLPRYLCYRRETEQDVRESK